MATIDGSSTFEQVRWQIAEKFGWTLEYIDSLALSDVHEYLQVQDGLSHAKSSIIR